jgi:uncharacterized protein (UPF0262 family)
MLSAIPQITGFGPAGTGARPKISGVESRKSLWIVIPENHLVIPAKAGIHEHERPSSWMPDQVRHDDDSRTCPGYTPRMADPRIIDIELDERTIIRRSDDIERERRVAIFDLLEANSFQPEGLDGPFRILLRIEDNNLAIDLRDEAGEPLQTVRLGLARFKRPVRDYFAICETYFKTVRSDSPKGLETIDMARRGVHNEAAELLQESLAGKIEMDFDTARRLFTLICVLHIK